VLTVRSVGAFQTESLQLDHAVLRVLARLASNPAPAVQDALLQHHMGVVVARHARTLRLMIGGWHVHCDEQRGLIVGVQQGERAEADSGAQ